MKIFQLKNRFFVVLFLSSFLLVFNSCSDGDVVPKFVVEGAGGTVKFDNATFLKRFNVISDIAWEVQKDESADWVTPLIKENLLELIVTPNTTGSKNVTNIVVKSKSGEEQVIHIEQDPTDVGLAIVSNSKEAWLNYYQTQYEFYVYADSEWTMKNNSSWATVDVTSGKAGSTKVVVNFDKNDSSKEKREVIFTIVAGEEKTEQKLIQRGKKSFEDADYYFHMHLATLPVLYSGIDIQRSSKPTFLLDHRGTLKKEELPSNVKMCYFDEFPNNFINEIRNIEQNNPDAIYAYYADDLRIIGGLKIFTRLGIDSSRVKFTLLPDGTGTYTAQFSKLYGEAGNGEAKFKGVQAKLENMYAQYMANPSIAVEETSGTALDMMDTEIPHVLAQYGGARYYIENKEYLITDDAYVKEEIKKSNYVVMPARNLLAELTPAQQESFYLSTGFDMKANSALMDESAKPNLIIIGTNTAAGTTSKETQAAYVKAVMDKYGEKYDVFYKAHPADPAYVTYEQDFPGLRLILPAAMPFDVFTWALNDKVDALGGFSSTVFLTVPTDKVKFMFAPNAEALGGLFYNVFNNKDIDWMTL